MDPRLGSELVHSMLEAVGSMQLLTDELDRISLQPEDEYEGPHSDNTWSYDSASLGHPSSSSRFDSAIGSQTDEDSLHSQSLAPSQYDSNVYSYTQELDYHQQLEALQRRSKPLRVSSEVSRSHSNTQQQRKKKRSKRHHSSSQRHSNSARHHRPPPVESSHHDSSLLPPQVGTAPLRREGSVQSISSTCSSHSSRILSIGLSHDDLRNIAQRPQFITLPPPQFREECNSADSGDSTPKAVQKTLSFEPQIIVVDPIPDMPVDTNDCSNVLAGKVDDEVDSDGWGTAFYHESLTPQSSPRHHRQPHTHTAHLLPRRYRDTTASPSRHDQPVKQRPNAPKRSASILQRLKRKHGSFNRTDRQPKRRIPVKRSFSDRIAYHIRKGWMDYEEDLEFISQPSRPRQVGRMIDTQAGRRHVVELYRPSSRKYGIYITEGDRRKGVFISRFADAMAAKFYIGLLSPGDEIIRVNGENVGDKSLDYVYDILEDLDAVVLTVIPVGSRPDW